MRKLILAASALLVTCAIALAANVPFLTGPATNEPSQTNAAVNQTIQAIISGMDGIIASQPGPVGATATTAAQTFATTTIPTSTLNVPGQAIHAKCWGIGSSTTNTKSVSLNFGTAVNVTSGSMTGANQQWGIDLYIQAVTPTANFVALGTGEFGTTLMPTVSKQVTADNLQTGLTLSCTGQLPTVFETNGLTMEGFLVEQVK
jgi:hypothetical protein